MRCSSCTHTLLYQPFCYLPHPNWLIVNEIINFQFSIINFFKFHVQTLRAWAGGVLALFLGSVLERITKSPLMHIGKSNCEKVQARSQNEHQISSTVMHTLEMRLLPLVRSL